MLGGVIEAAINVADFDLSEEAEGSGACSIQDGNGGPHRFRVSPFRAYGRSYSLSGVVD
jgi:hypothetical protein